MGLRLLTTKNLQPFNIKLQIEEWPCIMAVLEPLIGPIPDEYVYIPNDLSFYSISSPEMFSYD